MNLGESGVVGDGDGVGIVALGFGGSGIDNNSGEGARTTGDDERHSVTVDGEGLRSHNGGEGIAVASDENGKLSYSLPSVCASRTCSNTCVPSVMARFMVWGSSLP
jgi:hypothetical protein